MPIKYNKSSFYSALASLFILTSCGGGGGGDSSPPSRATGSISGYVYDAPISGAEVSVWEYDNGNLGSLLARTKTNAFGEYSVSIDSSSRPLLITAQGGAYQDPITGATVAESDGNTLRFDSVINYSEGDDESLMVTPLSYLAAGLAEYQIAQGVDDSKAVSDALETVNTMYGFDVNGTTPIDITRGGQSSYATSGHQYGALLLAYSSLAKDLIDTHGDTENVYTSANLAYLQHQDIIADGLLDGEAINAANGLPMALSYGQVRVSSDLYTNTLAQHVLIVVNDPALNISGTVASDYETFSKKINALGGEGDDGVIPARDEVTIDELPPTATRTDSDTLADIDQMDVTISDDIGVDDVEAYLQYQLDGVWSELEPCELTDAAPVGYCGLDLTDFERGVRETQVHVTIDTTQVDHVSLDEDELTNVTAARVVLYTSDVLGNALTVYEDQGIEIPFSWDNQAPVIDVTSASTINNTLTEYVLRATVKEAAEDITSVTVSFNGGTDDAADCTPVISQIGSTCEFSKPYPTEDFTSNTLFTIKATDSEGNVGTYTHSVSRDDTAPTQTITFPQNTTFPFIDASDGENRSEIQGEYNESTYSADTVIGADRYLKIDYSYGANGIASTIDDVDMANFNVNLLNQNNIPYLRVVVSDPSGESVIGSSAEDLKLVVDYYVSENNDGDYTLKNSTSTVASTDEVVSKIPHETIERDDDGSVNRVIYYIPYSRDIFGPDFTSVSEDSSQRLVIYTEDESGNESPHENVYFRSTFDLPTITVVTPFINARAQLEGLSANGSFTSLASCSTVQQNESIGVLAYDVASCDLTTDVVNYDFMRVRLISTDNSNTYYYQWQDNDSNRASVDLSNANFGAYFELDGSQTFYITELSVYQTGLFDYLWDQVGSGDKTNAKAVDTLNKVNSAVFGTNSSAFFSFDPASTPYATNQLLREQSIPSNPGDEYQHRFLAESIATMAEDTPRNTSANFATSFYSDFSYDGKANGIGIDGVNLSLDGYQLSADTYRTDLAKIYFDKVTVDYDVASYLAQLYADDISKANPMLNGSGVFDFEGESIDKTPPEPTVTIASGRTYETVNNRIYIAGSINAQVAIEDPSGIVASGEYAPDFVPYWYDSINEKRLANVSINQDASSSTNYKKVYNFTLDSQSAALPDIVEFALNISAMDNNGESYGYNGEFAYVQSFYVDNDYPVATYQPPLNIDGDTLSEDTYLNTNNVHELTFNIQDEVGDKLESRGLVFYKPTGERASYSYEKFSSNGETTFKVRLCNESACENGEQSINPGDGDWLVVVSAEDNLGNSVSQVTSNAPRFNIHIDSEPPVVNGQAIETRLGGNERWTPDIEWGNLAPGSEVKISLRRGSGQTVELTKCDPESEVCDQPYLVGDQPDVAVQLVADAFDYDATNIFSVTAKDSAYPANESGTGTFSFKVDNQGPTIAFDSPWAKDSVSGESYLLGRAFSVNLASTLDDSGVEQVALYQVGYDTPLKVIRPTDASNPFSMSLTSSDTDKIQLEEGNLRTDLVVKATDIYGFVSESNSREVMIDREGPTISLNGFSDQDYYLSSYDFDVIARDLFETGGSSAISSTQGVQDNMQYWMYTDTPPLDGVAGINIGEDKVISLTGLTNGQHTLRIEATDNRGNSKQQEFSVNVNNARPTISGYKMTYADGSDIGQAITRDDDILITMDIDDVSGVDSIEATYRYLGEVSSEASSFNFVEQQDGSWQARLSASQLELDGSYNIEIRVYNQTRYTDASARQPGVQNATISVQRQGVELSIASPSNFQSYIANNNLSVVFNVEGEVAPSTIECWVRENHTAGDVPADNSYAYSGVIHVSQPPYGCDVTTDRNMSDNVTLVARVTGTNGKESTSLFNFNMMDIDAPVVDDGSAYSFTGENIYKNSDGQKMLSFGLAFSDVLSGVYTDENNTVPTLTKVNGNVAFTPETCTTPTNSSVTTCTYTQLYDSLIDGLSTQQNFQISNLRDIAGNTAETQNIELVIPTGSLDVDITDPATGSIISDSDNVGLRLNLAFRVKVYENSRIDDITVRVGNTDYSQSQNSNLFSTAERCDDDSDYNCFTFSNDLSEELDGTSVRVRVTAQGVWGKTATDSINLQIDNTAPTIGDDVTVSPSSENQGKVRFRFDIDDSGSGIETVSYSSFSPEFTFNKQQDVNNTASYIELDAEQLEGMDSLRVNITATDLAGLSTTKTIVVDTSRPQVTLTLDSDVSMVNSALLFSDSIQNFILSANNSAAIEAQTYTVSLESDEMSNIVESGSFNGGTSANGSFTLNTDSQAIYHLKITVTDTIGRETQGYLYSGDEVDSRGLSAIVDFSQPTVSNVAAVQASAVPQDGKYEVTVSATVSDANLSNVTPTLTNSRGETFSVQQAELPQDGESQLYVYHYLVEAGSYTASILATDAANKTASASSSVAVAESSVPTLNITTSQSGTLSAGEEVELSFVFSEQVEGFDISDVHLSASDTSKVGSLLSATWNTADNTRFTVTYQAPQDIEQDVQISVEAGSYQSINTIEGEGDSLTLNVDGILPTLDGLTFTPSYQKIGENVTLQLTFNKAVASPEVSLGDTSINSLTSNGDRTQWTGQVRVPSTSSNQLQVSVSNYRDDVGNVGAENTQYSLAITPSIGLNSLPDVNSQNVSAVSVSGTSTRFNANDSLDLVFSDGNDQVTAKATVSDGGNWSTQADLSGLKDGTITVTVNGINALGAVADEVASSLELEQTLPELSSASMSLAMASEGDEVTITANFDKAVSEPSASTLGGNNISWTSQSGESATWTGSYIVPSLNSDVQELELIIAGFSDEAGNSGSSTVATQKLLITPMITLNDVSDANSSNAGAVIISGTSSRFIEGETLSVKVSHGSQEIEESVSVDASGSWTASVNVESFSDGTVNVTVSGTNQVGAIAERATGSFTLEQTRPALTSASMSPAMVSEGDEVTITANFDKAVSEPSASTLGGNNISWTSQSGESATWTGSYIVPSMNSDVQELELTIAGFSDEAGNSGESTVASQKLLITPTITLNDVSDANSSNAGAVIISGTSSRFIEGERLSVKVSDGSQEIEESVSVDASGSWTASVNVESFSDGTVNVTVSGTNQAGAIAESATGSFTLEQTSPELSSASMSPAMASEGDEVTITANFDKAVSEPSTSTLGGNSISWTSQSGESATWTGSYIVPSLGSDVQDLELIIAGFSDEAGNSGSSTVASQKLLITPTITLNDVSDVNSSNASAVTISGTSTRFSQGDTLNVKVSNGSQSEDFTANVEDNGSWAVVAHVENFSDGTVTITVSGSNHVEATAENVTGSFELKQTKPTLNDANTTISPQSASEGEIVTVNVTFREAVSAPTGSMLGSETIAWQNLGGESSQWQGTITVSNLDSQSDELSLQIAGYSDAFGNQGEDVTSTKTLLITPTPSITINAPSDITDDASSVEISGTSLHFDEGITVNVVATDVNNAEVSGEAQIQSDGTWSVSLDLSELADDTINISVDGVNQSGLSAQDSQSFNKNSSGEEITMNPTFEINTDRDKNKHRDWQLAA
ncbi:tandem large repeat [Vibrio sp. AK197]